MAGPMPRLSRGIIVAVFGWTLIGGAAVALRTSAAPATSAEEKPLAKFEVYKDRGGEFRWRRARSTSRSSHVRGKL